MTDVTIGLKRAALEKSGFAKFVEGKNQHDACVALGHGLTEWMKKTKYKFASCSVDGAGKVDFKLTVKLAKEATEHDAEEIRSYITGHTR